MDWSRPGSRRVCDALAVSSESESDVARLAVLVLAEALVPGLGLSGESIGRATPSLP